jgi:anthraniloyl-CoA monooxygenase
LLSNRSLWSSFVTLRSEAWHDGNVVFLGDAVHTAHFTIGSGTKLAMEDAIALVGSLQRHPADLERALTDYELERQPVVERFQQAAMDSAAYFENVRRYAAFEPVQFAFNLLTRSGRITHRNLEARDASFVAGVDGWFAARAESGRGPVLVAPPPRLAPIQVGGMEVRNRVVLAPVGVDRSEEGLLANEAAEDLVEAARGGAGVVLSEPVAVCAEGRITSGSPGSYGPGHVEAWGSLAREVHAAGGRLLVRLSHAGARGATRPRSAGVDRPLREGGWELVAASAVRSAPGGREAREATLEDLAGIRDAFARAAASAAEAGVDGVLVDLAHGYLLAGFLSPLTNRRRDAYGGDLEGRLTFPLEVLRAVRAAFPRLVGASVSASDWQPGGLDVDDAVEIVGALARGGCGLVDVRAGQTTARARPVYGRMFLVPAADRIRNEAGVPTLVSGGITTFDEVDTIVAAGRADLCVLDLG